MCMFTVSIWDELVLVMKMPTENLVSFATMLFSFKMLHKYGDGKREERKEKKRFLLLLKLLIMGMMIMHCEKSTRQQTMREYKMN